MSFYVHASNIHSGYSQQYGPFPGYPSFTYDLLRCYIHPDLDEDFNNPLDGDHFFQYSESHNGGGFIHQNTGETEYYGWRRIVLRGHPRGIHEQISVGPVWTDLAIEMTTDPTLTTNDEGDFFAQPGYHPIEGAPMPLPNYDDQEKHPEVITARTTWRPQ